MNLDHIAYRVKDRDKSASFFGNAKIYEQGDKVDQNLKSYQDGIYGGRHVDVEAKLEDAVYSTLEMFIEVNGVDHQEASQMVLQQVSDILGL